jgi:hypothetical protein
MIKKWIEKVIENYLRKNLKIHLIGDYNKRYHDVGMAIKITLNEQDVCEDGTRFFITNDYTN